MDTRWFRIGIFSVLSAIAAYFALQVKTTFDFEQFFPDGDPELEYFREFIENFETDDNFLLVAVEREAGVFDTTFLEKIHDFTLKSQDLPFVTSASSLTKMEYPRKTPFGLTTTPVLHRKNPSRLAKDSSRVLNDERFVNTLIAKDAKSMVVALKTIDRIELDSSRILMAAMDSLVSTYDFEDYHYVGRPNFQKEFVAMQQWEILKSGIFSGFLVLLALFFLFRRFWGIVIAILSIGLGLLFLFGILGASGRPMSVMGALYPVLMIIVGTSDVIHIISKYVDELRKGQSKQDAISVTVKEIGLATLLTSLTTAIGFITLLTSQIAPIRDFGINAAIGVILAFVTVIVFTTALLGVFPPNKIIQLKEKDNFWHKWMDWAYHFTIRESKAIAWASLAFIALCVFGVSKISTNYNIADNLPTDAKFSDDFYYFEDHYAGFRPLEFAVNFKAGYSIDSFEVMQQIDALEQHLRTYPSIQSVQSITVLYKSLNQAYKGHRQSAYAFPKNKAAFKKYRRLIRKMPTTQSGVFVSKDGRKTRISCRLLDVGSDSIKIVGSSIDQWIAANVDTKYMEVKRTGTGVLVDKNDVYIKRSLMQGLAIAILTICLLMAFLFRNWKMVIISLVPNVLPLLVAGAILGFFGIDLEAGIAIAFTIIFGIAVDDTIHFLSKYKLALNKGKSIEEALHITFLETGKAICLTTILLFCGFMVMLFSSHPPTFAIGLIIAFTLLSAVICDLAMIPLLIRWFFKDSEQ